MHQDRVDLTGEVHLIEIPADSKKGVSRVPVRDPGSSCDLDKTFFFYLLLRRGTRDMGQVLPLGGRNWPHG